LTEQQQRRFTTNNNIYLFSKLFRVE